VPDTYDLNISVRVMQRDQHGYSGGGALTVEHRFEVGASDFMEVAKILGQFHDLAEAIKSSKPAAGA
jgi:hypothetical protein